MCTTLFDVTERRRAEADLRRLGSAVDELGVNLALYDADERLVLCNRQHREFNHAVAETLVPGVSFEDHVRALLARGLLLDAVGREEEWLAECLERHRNPRGVYEMRRAGGVWTSVFEQRLPDGATVTLGTDISERKHAEEVRHEGEERLRLTLAAARIGTWVRNLGDGSVVWDRRMGEIYGVAADAHPRTLDGILALIHPDDRDAMAASARCVVEEDIDYFAECRIVRPDGAVRYVLSRAVVMRDDDGTPYRITGICMDVTERRESEDVLRRAKEDAELANRAKTEFLAAVSHELRTPLNAIIGFSETMNHAIFGPLGNATYEEYAEGILQSGRHLLGVINDILDVSRIESGRVEVEVEQVDVADTITAVLRLVDGRARERGVHLRTEPAPGLPALLGDEGHLKQILINLLSNAVKFTPEGGTVVVRAGLQADDLVIAVEDSGIGIAPEAIPKVLEPFVQADGGLSRRFGGTGLGLPLARRLTELQGGSLELDSTPGAGTTVRLRFPAEHLATRTDEVIGVVRHFR